MFRPRSTSRPEVFRRDAELNSSTSSLRFPDQPTPHSMLLIFKNYSYQQGFVEGGFANPITNRTVNSRGSGIGLRSTSSIELPFPKQLVDGTSLRINNFERDVLTEQIANRINNYISGVNGGTTVAGIPDAIQQMGAGLNQMLSGADGQTFDNIMNQVLGRDVKDIATAAQYLLRNKLPGDIQRSINTVTGQAINPRETLSFEGVNLRTHQFNWDLYPNNQADSERIREIVNKIKRSALPTTVSIADISKAFLQYPSTVEIRLIGVNTEHYMKFKPAMITNFTVDYGAGGNMSFLKGGKPAGVNISLQLTELEIETAEDYGAAAASPIASVPYTNGDGTGVG